MKATGYFLAVISAVTYGLIPLFILPVKAQGLSLDVTLLYRFGISALLLLALLLYKKESLKVSFRSLLLLAALGLLFALSSEFLFLAYDYLSAGIASTILFVYPVIVVLIMAFFFKERITPLTWISLLIALSGIGLLSIKGSIAEISLAGLLTALFSALCYALYIVIVNKSNTGVSGIKLAFYSILFSSFYYLLKSLWNKESLLLPDSGWLIHIALFGLLTSVISITTLVYAIRYIGSTPVSIMGAMEPVVAVFISSAFFGEPLTTQLLTGMVLILAGVILNIVADHSQQKVLKENS